MNKENKKLTQLAVLGLCILLTGIFIGQSGVIPAPLSIKRLFPENATPIEAIDIDDFGDSYDHDQLRTNQRYIGKMLQVSGFVDTSEWGTPDSAHILLRGFRSRTALDCSFNIRTSPALVNVYKDQVVTVTGCYTGMEGFTLRLRNCKLVSVGRTR